jgi:2-polyprenyl-6-methoxyphenol hydroxylase-like FAD-dependent oxidoreductase
VIAGGGPAGVMAGFLLARAGIDVIVLEKHADFFRDFRGDTIHPSTTNVLAELGLLDEFLKLPHSELAYVEGEFGDERFRVAISPICRRTAAASSSCRSGTSSIFSPRRASAIRASA